MSKRIEVRHGKTNIDKIIEFRFALTNSNGYVTTKRLLSNGVLETKYLDQIYGNLIAIKTDFNDGTPSEYITVSEG